MVLFLGLVQYGERITVFNLFYCFIKGVVEAYGINTFCE